jgi:hypothetical protein
MARPPTPTPADSEHTLNAVSCPLAGFCVAVDNIGNEVEGDPTVVAIPRANQLMGISCVTSTQCVAVDKAGNAFLGIGSASLAIGVPRNDTAPTISGAPTQGQKLTEAHGTWTQNPTGYTYRWQRCNVSGAACAAIVGATAETYTLAAADVGHTVRVAEMATNAGGTSLPATSVQTKVVAAPPAKTTTVTFDNQRITVTVPSPQACTASTGKLTVTVASAAIAKSKATRLTFASAAVYLDKGVRHTRTVTVKHRKKTVVIRTANATIRHVPTRTHLSLKGLEHGTHTLSITFTYKTTKVIHHRKVKVTATKKVTVKFTVC